MKHYYSLKNILSKNCDYNVIIGERSNGKTYSVLQYMLQNYVKGLGQFAYVRRWQDDIIGRRASNIFSPINANDVPGKLTKGHYDRVIYNNGAFYLARRDSKGRIVKDNNPCGYTFALSDNEHDKSTSYPHVTSVCFDEFLTRRTYLIDEFMLFMNVLSTIIRDRDNVKIFMLGNTVNRYSPYFEEMGLQHVKDMKQGTIDVYQYGDSDLKVAVEYCADVHRRRKSNKYFAFENKNLKMITQGKWELALYPHLPVRYKFSDIVFHYVIQFNDELLQAEVVQTDRDMFTYIHRKTTPIRKRTVVYSNTHSGSPWYYRRLLHPVDRLSQKISYFYGAEKVFFQDNTVGEIVRSYIHDTEPSEFAN